MTDEEAANEAAEKAMKKISEKVAQIEAKVQPAIDLAKRVSKSSPKVKIPTISALTDTKPLEPIRRTHSINITNVRLSREPIEGKTPDFYGYIVDEEDDKEED